MAHVHDRNQDATVYIGNLDDRCTDELVWELMVQAGPVVNVYLPKDRVTQKHQGYGFCEFVSEEDADYCIKIFNMVKLYGKPLRVNKSSSEKRVVDVGATLYIGNLDPDVDEKLLYDTFTAFGQIIHPPKIARDVETGNSKGFAFISFDNFDSSDAAIEAMNGQFLANKPINVSYSLKKDGKGERHGSAAERLLAAQAKKSQPSSAMPNRLFAEVDAPQASPSSMGDATGAIPLPPPPRPGAPVPGAGPSPYYPPVPGMPMPANNGMHLGAYPPAGPPGSDWYRGGPPPSRPRRHWA
ncbi:Spliceosome-associated protein 49 [Dimargaris xerosporica]|nr:Spliceosome-associated protein 49 [Dimargaris xerosporica]